MTGFESKRQAALEKLKKSEDLLEESVKALKAAQAKLDDDDAQGYIADYETALKIAYEIGFENGKKAQPEQQAEPFSAVSIHATQTAWKMGYEAAKAEMQPEQKTCGTCEALARTVMLDQTSHDIQRPWVGLTEQDMPSGEDPMFDHQYFCAGMVYAAKVLQEKNT
jgi:hypothetical protein